MDNDKNDFAAPLPYGNTYIDTSKLNWKNPNGFVIDIQDDRFVWVNSVKVEDPNGTVTYNNKTYKILNQEDEGVELKDAAGHTSTNTPFGENTQPLVFVNGGNETYIAYVGELQSYHTEITSEANNEGYINEITPKPENESGYLYRITYFDAVTLKDGSKGDLALTMKKVQFETSINVNEDAPNNLKDLNNEDYSYKKSIVQIQGENSLGVDVDQKDAQNNWINKYETVAMTKDKATSIVNAANAYLDDKDKLSDAFKSEKNIRHAIGGIYDLEVQVFDKNGNAADGIISYSAHDLDYGTHQNVWGRNINDEDKYKYAEGLKIVKGSKSYAVVPVYNHPDEDETGNTFLDGWVPVSPVQTLNGEEGDSLLNIVKEGDEKNADGVRFSAIGIINIRDENGKFEDVPFNASSITTALGSTYTAGDSHITYKNLEDNKKNYITQKLFYGRVKDANSLTSYTDVNPLHIYKLLGDGSWKIEGSTHDKSFDTGFAVLLDAKGSELQWSGSRQSGAGINTTLFESSIYTYLETSHGTGGGIYIESYDSECRPVMNEGAVTMGRNAQSTVTIVPEDGYRVKNIYIGNTNYGKDASAEGLADFEIYVIDGDELKDNDGNTLGNFTTAPNGIIEVEGFYYEKDKNPSSPNPDTRYNFDPVQKFKFERNSDGTIDVTLPDIVDPMHVHAEFSADFYFHKIWVGDKDPETLNFIATPYHLQYTFKLDLDGNGTDETYKMIGNKISGAGKSWDVVNNIWEIKDQNDVVQKTYKVEGNKVFETDDTLVVTMTEKMIVDHKTKPISFSVDVNSPMIYDTETSKEGDHTKTLTWHIKYPSDGNAYLEPMPIEEAVTRHDRNHTDRLYWFVSEEIPEWALEEYFNENSLSNPTISIAPGKADDSYQGMYWYEDATGGYDYTQNEINTNKISAYMSVFEIGGRIINTPAIYVKADKIWEDESNKYNSRKDIVLHIDRVLEIDGQTTTITEDILPPQLISAPKEGDTVENRYSVIWGNNVEYVSADPNKVVIKNSGDLYHGDDDHPIIYTRNLDGSYHSSSDGKDYYINELSSIDINGKPYSYKIRETYVDGTDINVDVVADNFEDGLLGYKTTVSDLTLNESLGNNVPTYIGEVTNTYQYIDVELEKTWEDNHNQDGYRSALYFVLYAYPELELSDSTVHFDDLSKDTLSYSWKKLPTYIDGEKVIYDVDEYIVDEENSSQYTIKVEEDIDKDKPSIKFSFKNRHTPETGSISIFKKWEDDENRDNVRKEVKALLESKTESEKQWLSVSDQDGNGISQAVVKTEDGLIITWLNLPVNRNGELITYRITEDVQGLANYSTTYQQQEFTLTNNENIESLITNTYNPEVKEITVNKVWDDLENHDGIRPESVTVQLVKEYEKLIDETEKVDKNVIVNNENYPVKKSSDGIEYYQIEDKYYIADSDVQNFVVNPEDNIELIVLSYDDEPITEQYFKCYKDKNGIEYRVISELETGVKSYQDLDGNPLTVEVGIFEPDPDNDDNIYETEIIQTYFEDQGPFIVYENADGKLYFIDDDGNYRDYYDGQVLNAFKPAEDDEVVQIDVKKEEYESVKETEDIVLSDENNWTFTFEVPANEAVGKEITYSFDETDVPEGYEKIITSTEAGKYTITNKHEVIINPPVAEPDETIDYKGKPQTGTPTFKADPDTKAPGGGENKIERITLLDEDGNEVNTVTVPGEGTYVLNDDGTITFTPEPEFVGKTSGVKVRGYDSNGLTAETTYTPTVIVKVSYVDPLEDKTVQGPEDSSVPGGKDITTTYEDTPGSESKKHPGYRFDGWEETIDPEDPSHYIRTAKYTPMYNINYDPNGGTGDMSDDDYAADDPSKPHKSNEFTRKGYTFTGFKAYITDPTTGEEKPIVDENGNPIIFQDANDMNKYFEGMPGGTSIRMEAQWKRNEYRIQYDGNGGVGDMSAQDFTGDDKSAVSKNNKFVRDGYNFEGFDAYDQFGNYLGFFKSTNDFIEKLHEIGDGAVITLVARWSKVSKYTPPKTGIE